METNVVNFIQAWNEVPVLAEILRIVESKKFIDSGDSKKSGHLVIGVMSPLARAMYTFVEGNRRALYAAKAETLMSHPFACFGFGVDCIAKIDEEFDSCPHASALLKVKELHPLAAHQDFIKEFMFSLIKDAFPDHGETLSGVSLIQNFQITTREKPESYPDTFETFKGWEDMTLQEMVAVSITGTFLQPLAEILQNGRFVDDEAPAFADGDSLVRLMKPLEKSIVTQVHVLIEGIKAKEDEHTRLLEGENFIKKSRPNIDFTPFGFLGTMISIDMSDDMSEETARFFYEPKDVSHPDCIRVEQINNELLAVARSVQPYEEILWPLIYMDLDSEKKNNFAFFALRAGFQIVAFNEPVSIKVEE
jgi:hypothetical protein